jgi:carbohydrate-selective porin OprB
LTRARRQLPPASFSGDEGNAALACDSSKACGVVLSLLLAAMSTLAVVPALAQSQAKSIWEQETLTGDWGGARAALEEKSGIEFKIEYTDEVFGVLTGGIRREPSYEGQLHFSVNTDLEKLIGWSGTKTHFTVFQIHDSGHNVVDNSGSIAGPSNIDALPTTRLYTTPPGSNRASPTVSRYGSAKSSPTANSSPMTRPAA